MRHEELQSIPDYVTDTWNDSMHIVSRGKNNKKQTKKNPILKPHKYFLISAFVSLPAKNAYYKNLDHILRCTQHSYHRCLSFSMSCCYYCKIHKEQDNPDLPIILLLLNLLSIMRTMIIVAYCC